ncbi:hypothetical protein K1719_002395 [Acacia pycnantha]|nr:hypothetical protein K1719_002395 [Acacia pycnantha]
MVSWAIQLSEFDITYEARRAIKSQAFADFVMELTPASGDDNQNIWKLFVDGSSNIKGSGAGIIVESPEGVSLDLSLRFNFSTSNNQAEYEALIAGLVQAKENGARRVHVSTDSQLVASQINGTYQAKGPLMIKYLGKVKEITSEFDELTVAHIPRGDNVRADVLSKLTSTKSPGNHRTIVQQNLAEPSCVIVISESSDWRKPITNYLERGILPDEPLEARKLMRKAASYALINDELYRKGLHSPMMKCLVGNEAHYVLMEIHEGINGHHMGAKALARKAVRAGYFWPTMAADAKAHVQKCDSFQKHASIIRSPPASLQVISAPWPFFKWGMDLLGPFNRAAGQLRWLIVAVDYFTKWIEVEPVATITSFIDKGFQELVAEFNIQQHFASVEHPQSNGQEEAAIKVIVDGLKKRMEDASFSWVDQLPYVLWGYQTSIQSSTGETPFKLTYGCEAMIPVEIEESSWQRVTALQHEEENNDAIAVELDLIDEVRIAAHCRDLAAKQLLSTRYNKNVRPRSFDKGSLVLRRADIGNKNAAEGKLAPNWEGLYRVVENLGKGAYKLETLQKKALKRTWNADKLKGYYS